MPHVIANSVSRYLQRTLRLDIGILHLEGYLACMHQNFNRILHMVDSKISSKISFIISPVSPR